LRSFALFHDRGWNIVIDVIEKKSKREKKREKEVFGTMWIKKIWEKAEEQAKRTGMERQAYTICGR